MAFGGSGFSFGSNNNNNNNNSSTGFGGFGSNNNNAANTGFGSSTTNTGFGTSTSGTNPFGGGTSTFGSNTGGFGASTNTGSSLFGGNKPATTGFGTSTGATSLFGGNNNNATTTTGGFGSGGFGASTNTGGFGSNTTNNNTGGGFNFGNTANKPAFGSSTTTPLFGQGGAGTTGGFGSTGGAFGSSGSGTALNQPVGPSEGTASTPFSMTSEKEPNGVTNNYQSITFQQPYQKYSFEELRLADYNAGRQFGNGSGQPGAFGSNAFGGFGSTNTGGFGATNNTTATANPFGTATTSSTTFGSNPATTGFGGGSGLFGNNANKPATGGLFGTQTSSAGTTGGLFGSTNIATTGTNSTFGGGSSNLFGGQNAGSSLFGNNNNQQNQNKPAGGLFGNNTTSTGGGFSFGANNNNTTTTNNTNSSNNLFGTQNQGSSLFGNNNNNAAANTNSSNNLFGSQNQGSSLFGNNNNTSNTNNSNPFGAQNSGSSLFGNKPAGTNTSGGLFGNNNNATNTGGGLFANNNSTANQSGQKSLFGGGFGTGNTGTNTGGGLFGNNNTTNNQASGGLFSNTNTNNNSGGFSFGNTSANKPTTSLFGNNSTNQQGSGLFGSTNNNNNSVFGVSQNNQQNSQQQQDGVKHASLLDPNPYGQSSIWTGLPPPTPENAKPVFTPLTATQKMKESMMKPPPSLRLNQSRYMTPPRRNGFGFSYSTYGTPSSAASTPGGASLSGSMYGSRGFSGGSFGRSFNKSASVQNLRSQFTSDSDDIWKPGAFNSAHRNSSGSIKRLTIDRTIRNDLFSRPSLTALPASGSNGNVNASVTASSGPTNGEAQQDTTNKLKKRVSFENGTSGGLQNSQLNGENGALVRTETDDDEQSVEGQNGRLSSTLAESQTRSKDLAAVPEDRESDHVQSRPVTDIQAQPDPKPGDYWMKPSRAEMAKMPRADLQKFRDFQVGRYGCGQVTFNGTVDLTALPLDDLYDRIVEIRLRSVTVYPDASSKPPVGKGLNVPSTISIENSWPRARNQPSSATSGPVFEKHVQRLKKMAGTEFVNYEVTTGVWTFRVPHYTRYGLDYDENEDDEMSELTAPPESIERASMEVDSDEYEQEDEDENDTFAFRQKTVPGGFGKQSVVDYEPRPTTQIFRSGPDDALEHSDYSDEEMSEDEPSMAGSYPTPAALNLDSPNKPILKPGLMGTPGKPLLDLEGDWAEQLQRTISPRKQNREALRGTQNKVLLDRVYSPIKPRAVEKQDFRTTIDIMHSIFGQPERQRPSGGKQVKANEPEFEFPYAKRAKTFDSSLENMNDADKKWHESFKTQFTGTGDFVYKTKSAGTNSQKRHAEQELVSAREEVVMKSSLPNDTQLFDLKSALASSEVSSDGDAPRVQHQALPFSYLAQHLASSSALESDLYQLLHILFDDYEDEFTHDLPSGLKEQNRAQIHKDRLTSFLSSYILRNQGQKIAKVEEEDPSAAAILKLTTKDIKGACDSLEKVGNYKLMVLVSQLENADETFQDDVKAQIDAWREQCVLSEMTEEVRALYELCAGNTTICSGKTGNVPVEDKAKTFSIGDEYGLDWLQRFALGLWFGREEKRQASTGVVTVENAVLEFDRRCQRREESQLPGNDPIWVILKIYASSHGPDDIGMPVFPASLQKLNSAWDASKAFRLHYAVTSTIEGVVIDEDSEEELIGLLAYQLSSKGDIAGAAYVLMHLQDSHKRETMLKNLLDRFAAQLPESSLTSTTTAQETVTALTPTSELWATLTQQLLLPASWLYQAKALYARAVSADSTKELSYLVAAKSWIEAHDCFVHRVAPSLVVDDDIDTLNNVVDLFDDDVMEHVPGWEMGGGIYSDFALMCMARGQLNQSAVEGLRKRLVEMGRKLGKKNVELGKLSIEDLEERVAVQEMSRVVAEKFAGSRKDLLELPLTSDQRLIQTIAMAGEYYHGIMAGAGAAA